MKKQKPRGFKGFGRQWETEEDIYYRKLERIELIDRRILYRQPTPQALENFKQLVQEGDIKKLTEYFYKEYGIRPKMARRSLSVLVEIELKNLEDWSEESILIFGDG